MGTALSLFALSHEMREDHGAPEVGDALLALACHGAMLHCLSEEKARKTPARIWRRSHLVTRT
jgi:hypothetical protein